MKHITRLVGALGALTILITVTDIDKQADKRSALRADLRAQMVAVGEIGAGGVGADVPTELALIVREHERARAQRGDSPTTGE